MPIHPPPADVVIDAPLVRALLLEQHPDLANLPLTDGPSGWDNQVYRLGDALAVRLPRRAAAATLMVKEHQWLPLLVPRLPLPISAPTRIGRPSPHYPWCWSVVPWFAGESGVATSLDALPIAHDLARFLQALHRPAPPDAPRNPWRGVPLPHRTPSMVEHVTLVGDRLDGARVRAVWEQLVRTPAWRAAPLWIHGDMHPGNLVLRDGRLSAVIDFGDLASGDPATDLSIAWMTMSASTRLAFRDMARNSDRPIDDHTWARARGWALALGVAYLAHARHDPRLATLGVTMVQAALSEQP